jgi:hypothetical protein
MMTDEAITMSLRAIRRKTGVTARSGDLLTCPKAGSTASAAPTGLDVAVARPDGLRKDCFERLAGGEQGDRPGAGRG